MICKHPYYSVVEGKLVCSQCGEPAPAFKVVEDKALKTKEHKGWPKGKKRK